MTRPTGTKRGKLEVAVKQRPITEIDDGMGGIYRPGVVITIEALPRAFQFLMGTRP